MRPGELTLIYYYKLELSDLQISRVCIPRWLAAVQIMTADFNLVSQILIFSIYLSVIVVTDLKWIMLTVLIENTKCNSHSRSGLEFHGLNYISEARMNVLLFLLDFLMSTAATNHDDLLQKGANKQLLLGNFAPGALRETR